MKYEIDILVNGKPVKKYNNNGQIYIEAKKGSQYEIKINNHLNKRIKAIISVDGIDVLSGKPADYNSRGYVINAYAPFVLKGYRVDDQNVAAFKFDDGEKSYATEVTKSKKSKNNGVIGIRIYEEYVPLYFTDSSLLDNFLNSSLIKNNYYHYSSARYINGDLIERSSYTSPSVEYVKCSADTSYPTKDTVPDFDVGTSWGSKLESKVTKTDFTRSGIIDEFNIYYTSREKLLEAGIIDDNKHKTSLPQAFQYCPPPKNWKG